VPSGAAAIGCSFERKLGPLWACGRMRPLRNLSKQVAASLNMRKGPPRRRLRSGTRPNVHGADDSGDSRYAFSGRRSDESRPARALACSYALHPRDAHQPSVPDGYRDASRDSRHARGLCARSALGPPVVVKKIIGVSLLLFKFKTPSDAEVPSCRRGHAQARLLPCRSPGLRGSGDA